MKIAHLADLHLGFRQFTRQAGDGSNQREADVGAAFARAVDAIVACKPDVIVIAGDLFHAPRPPNSALVHALRQCARLTAVAPVIAVAGNHDSPRSTDTGHILSALESVGVRTVLREPARVTVGDAAFWCVPDTGVRRSVAWVRDDSARYNVVVAHGEVAGAIGGGPGGEQDWPATTWDAGWDYVALGHYHVQQQVAARAWYAGAIEYTSSNPWAEISGPAKGWLLADLATGTVTPQPIASARPFVDCPRISAAAAEPAAVLEQVRAHLAALPDGAVVRQVITDCEPSTRRALNAATLRELRRGPLHLHLDIRRAVVGASVTATRIATRFSLTDRFTDMAAKRAEATGLDVATLTARGLAYLATAEASGLEAGAEPFRGAAQEILPQ